MATPPPKSASSESSPPGEACDLTEFSTVEGMVTPVPDALVEEAFETPRWPWEPVAGDPG
jgi:hypothetical protein